MSEAFSIIIQSARDAWKPPDRRPVWQWAEEHIVVDKTSPFPGKYKADTSPWTKELMEVFADNSVREINVMCAAQTSKTLTSMILLAWAIAEDPGPVMWVTSNEKQAKRLARTRLLPVIRNVEAIRNKIGDLDRHEAKTLEINFTDAPLCIVTARSLDDLQSTPIRWLFCDEARNYPPGALETVKKRVRAFWNSRTLVISTPGEYMDAVHQGFLNGDQRHYHVCCPKCGHPQRMIWANLKWDTNERTRPKGVWNFDSLAKTIRYECENCRHKIHDKPEERKFLSRSGRWIKSNPSAPSSKVSFTWNALIAWWIPWRELVEEHIRANEAAKFAALEPLKTFVTESLGEPWEERASEEVSVEPVSGLKKFSVWEHEEFRFLTADVQKDHLWYLCHAWSKDGKTRLLDEGKLPDFDSIEAKRMDLNVAPKQVLIDSGHEAVTVYRQCAKFGWTATKGENRDFYIHIINGKQKKRYVAKPQRVDPQLGLKGAGHIYIPLFLFSAHHCKDILAFLRSAQGPGFEIPENVSDDYKLHMESEVKRLRHHPRTGQPIWEWINPAKKPNHLFDCSVMQIVAALIAGLLMKEPEEIKQERELPII